jgi:hypothetical protein
MDKKNLAFHFPERLFRLTLFYAVPKKALAQVWRLKYRIGIHSNDR